MEFFLYYTARVIGMAVVYVLITTILTPIIVLMLLGHIVEAVLGDYRDQRKQWRLGRGRY
jgi:hypothetical protein